MVFMQETSTGVTAVLTALKVYSMSALIRSNMISSVYLINKLVTKLVTVLWRRSEEEVNARMKPKIANPPKKLGGIYCSQYVQR